MGKYKRKSERELKFTENLLRQAQDRIEKGESKRSVAKSLGVNECTLRKRLREVRRCRNVVCLCSYHFSPCFREQFLRH